jgi:5-methyltetrahydrofolate--homocysteine methyltransferase
MGDELIRLAGAVQRGDVPGVQEWVRRCLESGFNPGDILQDGLVTGMSVVGRRFKNDEIFLPEVMIAARAMNRGLEILDPYLRGGGVQYQGKMVLGTVRGDLHDVGKNIVSILFRGAGFEVIDLGIDVSEERFVEAVRDHRPEILGLSALLTMTLGAMPSTIQTLERAGYRDGVIVMVGGAPVTEGFAREIGADGYAPDAGSAVEKAKELIGRMGKGKGEGRREGGYGGDDL